jgi:hypothetical protein
MEKMRKGKVERKKEEMRKKKRKEQEDPIKDIKEKENKLDLVVPVYNLNIWEAEAGGFLVSGRPGLCKENLSGKK